MEIEQRNKLAAIMFDIKHKIKDGEYKEFMDILGKKEAEPDLENIRLVKIYFQHYEVHERHLHLTDCEIDTLDGANCDCCNEPGFTRERLTCTVKTRILEVYGKAPTTDNLYGKNTIEGDLSKGRIHAWSLTHFIKAIKRYKNIEDEDIPEVNHYGKHWLTDTSWIEPLKYTVMDKKEN